MITNNDRAGWFGASDTSYVVGNYDTQSFADWWGVKTGFISNTYSSWAMKVGNIMEHQIVDHLNRLNRQGYGIKKGVNPVYRSHLRLRANYDGITRKELVEIKTSCKEFSKVPLNYWRQCQVLMYATKRKKCVLWLYVLDVFDYQNPYFANIDQDRLKRFDIDYDAEFIKNEYLPRVTYLANCLRKGLFPCTQ